MIKTKMIPVAALENNTGQIKGLKKNPRFIKDDRYKHLVKSMKDFPDMLDLRELIVFSLGKKFITIAGNQRLRGGKENGYKSMPCKVLPASTSIAKLKRITILDNVQFGQDDWDLLSLEWSEAELIEWGMEVEGEAPPKKATTEQKEKIIVLKYNVKDHAAVKKLFLKHKGSESTIVFNLLKKNEKA